MYIYYIIVGGQTIVEKANIPRKRVATLFILSTFLKENKFSSNIWQILSASSIDMQSYFNFAMIFKRFLKIQAEDSL